MSWRVRSSGRMARDGCVQVEVSEILCNMYAMAILFFFFFFFFSSRRRHTRWNCDWSSDVCSSDLPCVSSFTRKRQPFRNNRCDVPGGVPRETRPSLLLSVSFHSRNDRGNYLRSEERRVGKECRYRWWV